MANIRVLKTSFTGGEVTPEFYGRLDDAKYQAGLALCRNMECLPHGPVTNRPGTFFVRESKDSTKKSRLIPFVYSTTQTFAIEMGVGYFRYHTNGQTLLAGAPAAYNAATVYAFGDLVSSGGINYYSIQSANTAHTPATSPAWWYPLPSVAYENPQSYAEADLFDIHYVQSSDVLTLVHPNYPPAELRRVGATNWQLVNISFASVLTAPTAPLAVATGAGAVPYSYVIAAVDITGLEEGLASAPATCNNNLATGGNYNTITWAAVSGALRYNVYKQSNGLYGYIGQTDQLTFKDDNITADVSQTPPIQNNPFVGAGNYPGAVSYFEQRRTFAGTLNKPQNMWMTRSGTESNLNNSIPTNDADAINFRVFAREANTIRHIVPITDLLLLTSSAEWRVTSVNSDAITPTSISVRPQSYIGASNVQPVIVNNNILYIAARGGHLRELAYTVTAQNVAGYVTGDLSLRAPHLFDGFDIVDMSYAKSPQPIAWMVSTSSNLIGITYVPEQQVGAIHHHDTINGVFESVTVVAEGSEDAVYVIVRRVINGVSKRYIERFSSRRFATLADSFFVDCGATYNGAPATVISGLTWLEGQTVAILTDGATHPQRVVTGGSVTLDYAASKVQVGLPITADIQLLPFSAQIDGFGQGRQKNVNKVWLRVNASSGILAGPSFDSLVPAKQRTNEPFGAPPRVVTGEVEIDVPAAWGDSAMLCVRQADPLPLTIVSLELEVAIGG